MADNCPVQIGDPAVALISNAHGVFQDFANAAFSIAIEGITNLQTFVLEPVNFTASFDFDDGLFTFHRPSKPERPDVAYNPDNIQEPSSPEDFEPATISFDAAPTFNEPAPIITLPPRPGDFAGTEPGDGPVVDDVTVPAPPVLVIPSEPPLVDLLIPAPPVLNLPTFAGTRPVMDIPIPTESFSFVPEQYASALLDTVRAKITEIIGGGTGLPAAVEQALRDRAFAEVDRLEARALAEVDEEFAARGFSEPQGDMVRRRDEVRQDSRNRKSALSRDIYIQAEQVEIEQLRFAVTSGIALEQVLVSLHVQMQQLALSAAQFALDVSIRIFDARVALFNALYQAFAVEAAVFRDLIAAELARVELYRAQIEGEKAKGEINEQRTRLYEQQINAVRALVEVYNSQVNGVRAQAEVQASRVDVFRSQVAAFAERVRAYSAQWDGYKSAVQAEGSRADVFKALADAFGTRVQAWATGGSHKLDRERLRIQQHGTVLQTFQALLQKMIAQIQAERERVSATVQVYQSDVQAFVAEGQIEGVASDAANRTFQLGLERARAEVDTALKDAEIRINQNVSLTTISAELQKTIAQVASNLAAASMSAVNYSTSLGSSRSEGRSCSTSFSYQGEIADA